MNRAPKELLEGRWPSKRRLDPKLKAYVSKIIDDVKRRGDEALIEFTKRFDGVELEPNEIRVSEEEIEEAYNRVRGEEISAVKLAKERLERLEKLTLERLNLKVEGENLMVYRRVTPIRSVGCYIPGGEASYPSTVMMAVVPARVAGVPRIAICTPPRRDGGIEPLTLVAADICGVSEIYRVGGAQAVAALAYGTETIEPVDKIVGPGNIYVTAAKMLVSVDVPIDMPAGPSEILILADGSADPRIVALDMISQAEHGVGCTSILVTTSEGLADRVLEELERTVPSIPRGEIVAEALSRNGLILICGGMDEAVDFVNQFAPEHLEVMTENPAEIAGRITSAGVILTGDYSPASASDYCLGTNHILPTGGYGHVFSGLSVLNFVKITNVIECSRDGLIEVRDQITTLALAEGLPNHASAVEGRVQLEG